MKLKLILSLATIGIAAHADPTQQLVLTWVQPQDARIDAYRIYEQAGTNWVLAATVPATNNMWTVNVIPGMHVFALTCAAYTRTNGIADTNCWVEGPFSMPASYFGPPAPSGTTLVRLAGAK